MTNKRSVSDTDLSLDSLDEDFKRKLSVKNGVSNENIETILVPFYEKDVLLKIPRERKKHTKPDKIRSMDKLKKDSQQICSYLINKDKKTKRNTTYLEMFRKQFTLGPTEKKKVDNDIGSLSPEVGDTERESIEDETSNRVEEFYNTESYNEIYYEKLLSRPIDNYFDNSSNEELNFDEEIRSQSPDDNNLRSISEVTQPRRHRRATVQPIQDVKLGGLGPDMERIKPRLERARSLQRYSEKVRMENRLRIYKNSVQDENHRKLERAPSAKREPTKDSHRRNSEDENASYLVNKSLEKKSAKNIKNIYNTKSKSASAQKIKEKSQKNEEKTFTRSTAKIHSQITKSEKLSPGVKDKKFVPTSDKIANDGIKKRVKSSAKSRTIHTEIQPDGADMPAVHISFLVNVGNVRPSSALRSLEEKHRIYQERVKSFMDNND